MKVAVIGTGYVGLVSGACFADMGNDVICVDVDEKKIEDLNHGIIPIYEPGLKEIVDRNTKAGRLIFTTKIETAVNMSQICFIAVGTPMGEDGSADLHYVLGAAADIGRYMTHPLHIIDKSTVPVGTAKKVRDTIQRELDERSSDLTFEVISNPEFLKEGTAVNDCLLPDRIIIGTESEQGKKKMRELYAPFVRNRDALIFMDITSAEMTKYAANSMLATKISFMNEIANICELVGADVNKVRMGIGSDHRIGYQFIYPGCGYGGSCFPKDVQALIRTNSGNGYIPRILEAVEAVNYDQKRVMAEKVVRRFGEDLSGLTIAVWGLAFKPDTDDMRQSAAIIIIEELTRRGAAIHAYDPKAMEAAKQCYLKDNRQVVYYEEKYEALCGCDAMVLVTEWKEFRSPDYDIIKHQLRNPIIFDGRNQYNGEEMTGMGFEYYQVGVGMQSVEWVD